MTADERLEQLLNRAGQTISDLPKSDGIHLTYDRDSRSNARQEVFAYAKKSGYVDVIDCLAMHQDYILHLTDVIDRLEWALDNVTRERDWLKEMNRLQAACQTCAHHVDGDPLQCADGKRLCHLGDDGACLSWEYCGVPEDWRADE